ncbi:UDP-N-acetylglucosamine 2-epimerase (non-hydrolyzing) [Flavobacteriaceae bacterium PRS1]|nr:UDP-N-acetylglucosamine 2-epimerase (non-hydrolyzing) [Flavobacteriaceae bacterium PRS1]
MKLISVVGARPNFMKIAPFIKEINTYNILAKDRIEHVLVHTGQHYDNRMSKTFFKALNIPKPNYNLKIGSGSHGKQTARMIEGLEELLLSENPDYLLLYGDTNSTLSGAIAASKLNIPIVHVEAGLRSNNRKMPEKINRIVCDHLSSLLFSPTQSGFQNLINEGFNSTNQAPFSADNPGIFHYGVIMYDNSLHFADLALNKSNILAENGLASNKYVLATIHRDHNTDIPENLMSIFEALITISRQLKVVLPIHPRTKKILQSTEQKKLLRKIKKSNNLLLIPPVSFLDMIQLEKNTSLIITDSGGVQKESYFFNKPCIVLRPETEWIEILETGKAKLVSADYKKILIAFDTLINLDKSEFPHIFGDGKAAEFICETII